MKLSFSDDETIQSFKINKRKNRVAPPAPLPEQGRISNNLQTILQKYNVQAESLQKPVFKQHPEEKVEEMVHNMNKAKTEMRKGLKRTGFISLDDSVDDFGNDEVVGGDNCIDGMGNLGVAFADSFDADYDEMGNMAGDIDGALNHVQELDRDVIVVERNLLPIPHQCELLSLEKHLEKLEKVLEQGQEGIAQSKQTLKLLEEDEIELKARIYTSRNQMEEVSKKWEFFTLFSQYCVDLDGFVCDKSAALRSIFDGFIASMSGSEDTSSIEVSVGLGYKNIFNDSIDESNASRDHIQNLRTLFDDVDADFGIQEILSKFHEFQIEFPIDYKQCYIDLQIIGIVRVFVEREIVLFLLTLFENENEHGKVMMQVDPFMDDDVIMVGGSDKSIEAMGWYKSCVSFHFGVSFIQIILVKIVLVTIEKFVNALLRIKTEKNTTRNNRVMEVLLLLIGNIFHLMGSYKDRSGMLDRVKGLVKSIG